MDDKNNKLNYEIHEKYRPNVGGYEAVNVFQVYPTASYFTSPRQGSSVTNKELHPLEVEAKRNACIRQQNRSVIQMLPGKHITVLQTTPETNANTFEPVIWDSNEVLTEPLINQSVLNNNFIVQSDIPLTVQFCGDSDTGANVTVSDDDEYELPTPVFDHDPDPDEADDSEKDSDMTNRCYMCFKRFKQKKNMYAHIRKIHSTQPKIEGSIICPMCQMHSLRHEHLRHHLESLHSVKIHKEEKLLNSIEEFNEWKANVEQKTYSYFVSKGASKLLAGIQTKSYFKCHRSGVSSKAPEPRKRKRKKQGSYKIGVTCPAAIEVTENVHGIQVTYWSTHIGHSILSEDNGGSRVRGLLGAGMLWDQVLDLVQHESEDSKSVNVIPSHVEEIKAARTEAVVPAKKPKSRKMVKSVSQAILIEKADTLLNFLETTEVASSFRPLISNMIDNLTSIAKRRSIGQKSGNKALMKSSYPHDSDASRGLEDDRLGRRRTSRLTKR